MFRYAASYFADPDAHLGYAYVMNKLNFWLMDDPREKPLRDAVYRAIARRTGRDSSRKTRRRRRIAVSMPT